MTNDLADTIKAVDDALPHPDASEFSKRPLCPDCQEDGRTVHMTPVSHWWECPVCARRKVRP